MKYGAAVLLPKEGDPARNILERRDRAREAFDDLFARLVSFLFERSAYREREREREREVAVYRNAPHR